MSGARKDKEFKSIVENADGEIARVVTPSYVEKIYKIADLFNASPTFPPTSFDKITEITYLDRYELVYSLNGTNQFAITFPFFNTSGEIDTTVAPIFAWLLEDDVSFFLLEDDTFRFRIE